MFPNADVQQSYERIVEILSLSPERYFGNATSPVFLPIDFVSRPGSEIVKCRVRFAESELVIYIKFFLFWRMSEAAAERIGRRIKDDVEITSLLYARLNGNSEQRVPKIVAYFPEERAVVTEQSEGEPLLDIIAKCAGGYPRRKILATLAARCHAVGRWLKEFQKITATDSSIAELEADVLGYVDHRLRKLAASSDLTKNEHAAVLKFLERKLSTADCASMRTCGVHGDFGPSNILVHADQVTVLDFAMYNIGLPYIDPSYLYQRMEGFLTKPFFRRSTIEFLQRSFLDGYQPNFDLHHPMFEISRVRHMVNRLVDLTNADRLSGIKILYQRWQYTKCLNDLKQIVTNSSGYF
jgi:tRNA A-37 threonylcarbamoyl transferase component Bud32